MGSVYDEVDLADMEWDEEELAYFYPCPCGDRFFMPLEELWDGEDIAGCPSCTLEIRVLFDESMLPELPPEDEGGEGEREVAEEQAHGEDVKGEEEQDGERRGAAEGVGLAELERRIARLEASDSEAADRLDAVHAVVEAAVPLSIV